MTCPDLVELLRHVGGDGDEDTAAHVAACPSCRGRCDALGAERSTLSGVVEDLRDDGDESAPPRLGGYRVLGRLGAFAGGSVLRAEHDRLGEPARIYLADREAGQADRKHIGARATPAIGGDLLGVDFSQGRPYVVFAVDAADAEARAVAILFGEGR